MVRGDDIKKVGLRKAGLGILSNMPGDAKPVPVIEDTAVHPEVLPDYIAEFDEFCLRITCHVCIMPILPPANSISGPVLNLKDKNDRKTLPALYCRGIGKAG